MLHDQNHVPPFQNPALGRLPKHGLLWTHLPSSSSSPRNTTHPTYTPPSSSNPPAAPVDARCLEESLLEAPLSTPQRRAQHVVAPDLGRTDGTSSHGSSRWSRRVDGWCGNPTVGPRRFFGRQEERDGTPGGTRFNIRDLPSDLE